MRTDYPELFRDAAAVTKYENVVYRPGGYSASISARQRDLLRTLLRRSFAEPPVQHDFACGTGRALLMLSDVVRAGHGYDVSPAMLRGARDAGCTADLHLVPPDGPVPVPAGLDGPSRPGDPAPAGRPLRSGGTPRTGGATGTGGTTEPHDAVPVSGAAPVGGGVRVDGPARHARAGGRGAVRASGPVRVGGGAEGGVPVLVTMFRLLLNATPEVRDRALAFAAAALPHRDAGLLVVENHGRRRSLRHLGRWRHRRDPWFSELSDREVRDLLARHGFELVAVHGFALTTRGWYEVPVLRAAAGLLDTYLAPRLPSLATDVLYVARRTA